MHVEGAEAVWETVFRWRVVGEDDDVAFAMDGFSLVHIRTETFVVAQFF